MGGQKVTDDQIMAELRRTDGHRAQAARNLGLSERALLARLQRLRRNGENIPKGFVEPGPDKKDEFVAPSLPDDDIPVEQLIEHMKRRFERKREYEEASKLIPIRITIPGPIGILHFGDSHDVLLAANLDGAWYLHQFLLLVFSHAISTVCAHVGIQRYARHVARLHSHLREDPCLRVFHLSIWHNSD